MNPKAWLKLSNSKSLCSFSSLIDYPGRFLSSSEICSDESFIINSLMRNYIKS